MRSAFAAPRERSQLAIASPILFIPVDTGGQHWLRTCRNPNAEFDDNVIQCGLEKAEEFKVIDSQLKARERLERD